MSTPAKMIRPPVAADGLGLYMRAVRQAPWLDAQEEHQLAVRLRRDGDRRAAERLIMSHLRMVVPIAMSFRGYGVAMTDVIAEGNIGLMEAVRKFDPERGCRLSTLALWYIRTACAAYVMRSWSLVKIGTTAQQKKLFFGLWRAKARLSPSYDRELDPGQAETIAEVLGVKAAEVLEMDRRLYGDAHLNAPLRADGAAEWMDLLVDEGDSPETALAEAEERATRSRALAEALAMLSPRERQILRARRLAETPRTLDSLATEHGVTRERIRQIEVRAFEKLHDVMTSPASSIVVPAGRVQPTALPFAPPEEFPGLAGLVVAG
jgi:RNA polymerase sigma-32 factor